MYFPHSRDPRWELFLACNVENIFACDSCGFDATHQETELERIDAALVASSVRMTMVWLL